MTRPTSMQGRMRRLTLLGNGLIVLAVAALYGQAPAHPRPPFTEALRASGAVESVAKSVPANDQRTGHQQRSYRFPATGESVPYHLYVPTTWNRNTQAPVVVVLHGDGAAPESMFERNNGILATLAEDLGFIIVAPTGYVSNGRYNARLPIVPAVRGANASTLSSPPPDRATRPVPRIPLTDIDRQRSEEDVLAVTDLVVRDYNADSARVYLLGNSAGGAGVWHLGQKYPERWAAIAPCAAPLPPEFYPFTRLGNLPVMVVHGDRDDRTSFDASVAMVSRAKALGVQVTFVPVSGGDHYESWATAAPQIFHFFANHRTRSRRQ